MTTPAVSWLVGAFNAEATLARALDSILAQTFRDFEVLVLDDGSTDGTFAVLERFATRDDRIVPMRFAENRGLTAALIQTHDRARGRFVARLDADDEASPDRLAVQLAHHRALGEPERVLIGSGALWLRDGMRRDLLNPTGHDRIAVALPVVNCFVHSSLLFTNTPDLRYRAAFRLAQDYDLALRALDTGVRLANVPELLVTRHDDAQTIGQTRAVEQSAFAAAARALHRARRDGAAEFDVDALLQTTAIQREAERVTLDYQFEHALTFEDWQLARRRLVTRWRRFGPKAGQLKRYLGARGRGVIAGLANH